MNRTVLLIGVAALAGLLAVTALAGCENFATRIAPAKSDTVKNVDDRTYEIEITPEGQPLSPAVAPPGKQRSAIDDDRPPVVLSAGPVLTCSEMAAPEPVLLANKDEGDTVIDLGDGRTIRAPRGSSVRVKAIPNGDGVTHESATAQNAGVQVNGNADKLVEKLQLQSPDVKLADGTSAKGGGTALSATFTANKTILFFYIFGGLLIVGGVVVIVWLKQVTLGLALIVAGVALIAVGVLVNVYPWIFLVAFGVLGLLALVWFLAIHKAANGQTALEAIVAGVHKAPVDSSADVKANIVQAAGGNAQTVKDTVTGVKRSLGLHDGNEGTGITADGTPANATDATPPAASLTTAAPVVAPTPVPAPAQAQAPVNIYVTNPPAVAAPVPVATQGAAAAAPAGPANG